MKRLLLLCGLLIAPFTAWAAELTAALDRNEIQQTETVQLTIHLNGYDASSDPDLKPLMRDFEVLGSAKSSQLSVINGQSSQQMEWQITLAPRRSGSLTIPAIQVGSLTTQPLTLIVSKASGQPGKTDTLFLEVQAQPKQPYVQSQVLYSARLYVAEALQSGSLTDPVVPNAIVLRLGSDRTYQTTRNGRRYQVVERFYGIFPQKPGTITITSPTFLGQALVKNNQTDPFFPQLKPVRLTAEPVTVTVQDKPAAVIGENWLPAQELTANEEWSPPTGHSQVGEPITRTITLSAVGLSGEQLPDLSNLTADGFNIYPGQPKIATTANDKAVLGQRVIKLTYIPTKAGTLTIPALTLPWWNTLSQKNQTLILPAKQLTVAKSNNNHTELSTASSTADAVSTTPKIKENSANNYWLWLIIILVTTAWLLTLWLWWRQQRHNQIHPKQKEDVKGLTAIKAACQQNNPQAAKAALIAWAQTVWPQQKCRNLADVIAQVTASDLKAKLAELDQMLYADQHLTWDGDAFWQVFAHTAQINKSNTKAPDNPLPPLYPK